MPETKEIKLYFYTLFCRNITFALSPYGKDTLKIFKNRILKEHVDHHHL
jgi:hypothetical protein